MCRTQLQTLQNHKQSSPLTACAKCEKYYAFAVTICCPKLICTCSYNLFYYIIRQSVCQYFLSTIVSQLTTFCHFLLQIILFIINCDRQEQLSIMCSFKSHFFIFNHPQHGKSGLSDCPERPPFFIIISYQILPTTLPQQNTLSCS